MPRVSLSFINAGRNKGKLTRGQIRLLTGSWLNPPGWEKAVIGKEIDERTARLFLRKFPPHKARKPQPPVPDDRRARLLRQFGARRTKGILG